MLGSLPAGNGTTGRLPVAVRRKDCSSCVGGETVCEDLVSPLVAGAADCSRYESYVLGGDAWSVVTVEP
jgi:hypothetical protein